MTRTPLPAARVLAAAFLLAAAMIIAPAAHTAMEDPFADRLAPEIISAMFPDADAAAEIAGAPPVATITHGGAAAGYMFSTWDLAAPAGYSGEPFDIIVGLDLEGRVTGAALLEHYEPMIGPELIPVEALQRYLDTLTGMRVSETARLGRRGVDGVSGATISSTLMTGAVLLAGRRAARRAGLAGEEDAGALRLDTQGFVERDWSALAAAGLVRTLRLSAGDVESAFSRQGRMVELGDDDELFTELHAALATPADAGRNIYGNRWYNHHLSQLAPGDHMLSVAAGGGRALLQRGGNPAMASRHIRLRIRQGSRALSFDPGDFLSRTAIRAVGAPRFSDHALYRLRSEAGFDMLRPWVLDITVPPAAVGLADDGSEPARFTLPYEPPRHLITGSEDALVAAGLQEPGMAVFGLVRESALNDWQLIWAGRAVDILILGGLLLAVTLVFLLQDALSGYRRLHRLLRSGLLAVTLVWLGWMHDAQLSILNILTWIQALSGTLDWQVLLVDPLILILSAYVALSLVLWGRGVFCGWLCPFGALQELANRAARLLRVPQIPVPEVLQEKLWSLKYVIAAVIGVIAIGSMDTAARVAEVEPFKTAIVVMFDRGWPFVAWAALLLAVGLFIERFFCRYLCPLGGALTLLGRFHLLHWLKRRPECGNPCSICRTSCPIGAIAADGAINENECLQCLDCQVDYYDRTVCPPLVARQRRLQRAAGAAFPAS